MPESSDFRSPLATPAIIGRAAGVRLAGTFHRWPTTAEIFAANKITERQLRHYTAFSHVIGTSEEAEGQRLSLMRKVARLERRKHFLLQMERVHLLPAWIRGLMIPLDL